MKRGLLAALLCVALLPGGARRAWAFGPSSTPTIPGIDVSRYQGEIDFAQVAAGGVQAVYIRAGAGNGYQDPAFARNYENAAAAGLDLGFYWSVTATDADTARAQARAFAAAIAGKRMRLRPAMDYERAAPPALQSEIALAFLQELAAQSGKPPVVYASASRARDSLSAAVARAAPLWVADYGVDAPRANGKWETWVGFQYTDEGRVPGIEGAVDRDRFTREIYLADTTPPPAPAPAPPAPRQDIVEYTVRRGDTLWAIAHRYNTTVAAIVRENGILNPNRIFPGELLHIQVDVDAEGTRFVEYTVRRGDTLWAVARRYDTTVAAIARENNISNPNRIFPGEALRVPLP